MINFSSFDFPKYHRKAEAAGAVVEPIAEEFSFGGDEYGKIRLNSNGRSIRAGDKVTVRPSHCDTTVNLYGELIGIRNGIMESVWRMTARGRSN